MVILLRAPLARPTAIERLCKKRREPDRLPESAPTARKSSRCLFQITRNRPIYYSLISPGVGQCSVCAPLPKGRHRGYSLSRPQAYCRKLAPHEGGRHPYRRAIARHKDLRMAARYQHLSPGFLADAVGTLDGNVLQEDFLP